MIYKLLQPLLFQQDPEKIHDYIIQLGKKYSYPVIISLLNTLTYASSKRLQLNIAGISMRNPIGLAAGFDKNGEMIPLLNALGFGHIEIGSVTAHPSQGNPTPRLFRLPADKAIINRMGLNNHGVNKVVTSLHQLDIKDTCYGINIAKTHSPKIIAEQAIQDFIISYQQVKQLGKYTTINISCPNTAEGKTFEDDPVALNELLQELDKHKSSLPLFIKLSPDLSRSQLELIFKITNNHAIDGYIVGNTSQHRSNLLSSPQILKSIGRGGLSGQPIFTKSTKMVHNLYALTAGKQPIIGTGGIMSVQDIIEKIKHGASIVQLFTGLIYHGPCWISQLNRELDNYLIQNQMTIQELKGAYHGH